MGWTTIHIMRPNYSLQPWCQAGVGRGSNISRCCNAESQQSLERLSWVFWWPGALYTFRQFLQLSRLCDLMRVCRAGCYCCVVFWWLFRPITVLVGVRFKPGLSSPPLALDMCKQNICMANITNKTNATSLFPATSVLAAISKIHGCFIWRCGTTELSLSGIPGQESTAWPEPGARCDTISEIRILSRDQGHIFRGAQPHVCAGWESLHQPEWQR